MDAGYRRGTVWGLCVGLEGIDCRRHPSLWLRSTESAQSGGLCVGLEGVLKTTGTSLSMAALHMRGTVVELCVGLEGVSYRGTPVHGCLVQEGHSRGTFYGARGC